MDRRINIPEILDIIFSHICPADDYFVGKGVKDLAALARTCKTFHNPALDALWKDQYSLFPALRCLPDDIWDRSVFKRALVPADWEHAMTYWARIRTFQIFSFSPSEISPDACEMLRLCCPGEYLFPNLREIHWLEEESTVFPVIGIFLALRLSTIRLRLFPGTSLTQLSFLSSLGVKYPNLTDVDLRGRGGVSFPPQLMRSVSALLCPLKNLQSFSVNSLDAAVFQHLVRLPQLQDLLVDELVDFDPFSGASYEDQAEPSFPALESLTLW
ncbi:hypothetical protein DFH07DRAFT_970875 [Mycena maculata]|uniref:F-box domain-containing protein n=1 Tax=Mycena maculata TaxID=230809 RepID=A0AAD7MNA0_9AGAR|nr:hypothetical protein DFH07DRAFT_970875 [Mycena maculata]